jgi:hypothetical protein
VTENSQNTAAIEAAAREGAAWLAEWKKGEPARTAKWNHEYAIKEFLWTWGTRLFWVALVAGVAFLFYRVHLNQLETERVEAQNAVIAKANAEYLAQQQALEAQKNKLKKPIAGARNVNAKPAYADSTSSGLSKFTAFSREHSTGIGYALLFLSLVQFIYTFGATGNKKRAFLSAAFMLSFVAMCASPIPFESWQHAHTISAICFILSALSLWAYKAANIPPRVDLKKANQAVTTLEIYLQNNLQQRQSDIQNIYHLLDIKDASKERDELRQFLQSIEQDIELDLQAYGEVTEILDKMTYCERLRHRIETFDKKIEQLKKELIS